MNGLLENEKKSTLPLSTGVRQPKLRSATCLPGWVICLPHRKNASSILTLWVQHNQCFCRLLFVCVCVYVRQQGKYILYIFIYVCTVYIHIFCVSESLWLLGIVLKFVRLIVNTFLTVRLLYSTSTDFLVLYMVYSYSLLATDVHSEIVWVFTEPQISMKYQSLKEADLLPKMCRLLFCWTY